MKTLPSAAKLAVALFLLLGSGGDLLAAPVSCHCFRDRVFNPSMPAEADPYILATTQNSFFAVAFGVPKGDIVRAKMRGIPGDDLWIAYYAGSLLRLPPGDLIVSRRQALSWKNVFESRRVPLDPLDKRFLKLLQEGRDDELASAAAVDVVVRTLGFSPGEVNGLAAGGIGTKRIVTACLLAKWSGRPARALVQGVEEGTATWSGLMSGLGIHPDTLEERIALLMGRQSGR